MKSCCLCKMPNYYEILGCDKTASYEEIKKCYHEQVKKCHPDKSSDDCQNRFLLLDKAWKTLRNENTRKEYDWTISKSEEMPLYCEVDLSEMEKDPQSGTVSYVCRCGGLYVLDNSDLSTSEQIKVSCDECTFQILINLNK